jgi:hypothetical protein
VGTEFGFSGKYENKYSMQMSRFPLTTNRLKQELKRDAIKITDAKPGENVSEVACFNASRVNIRTFVTDPNQ